VTLTINPIDAGDNTNSGAATFNATPTANRPIYIFFGADSGISDSVPPEPSGNVSGCNLTWSQVTAWPITTQQTGETEEGPVTIYRTYKLFLWRGIGASPTSGTITVTASDSISVAFSAFEVVNGDQNPLQVAIGYSFGSSLMSTTLGAFQDPVNNLAVAGYFSRSKSSMTPESGWTTIHMVGSAVLLTAYHVGEDTSPTANSSSPYTEWISISFETKEAPPGPPPPPPPTRSTVYFFM
jgi:hypothetical protein